MDWEQEIWRTTFATIFHPVFCASLGRHFWLSRPHRDSAARAVRGNPPQQLPPPLPQLWNSHTCEVCLAPALLLLAKAELLWWPFGWFFTIATLSRGITGFRCSFFFFYCNLTLFLCCFMEFYIHLCKPPEAANSFDRGWGTKYNK